MDETRGLTQETCKVASRRGTEEIAEENVSIFLCFLAAISSVPFWWKRLRSSPVAVGLPLVSYLYQYYNTLWTMQRFEEGYNAMLRRFAKLLPLVALAWLLVPASAEAG